MLRLALPSDLAIEFTIHIATTTIITAHTTLVTSPCLPGVLEVDRLPVGAAHQHLEYIGKLAVNVDEAAARDAELRDTTNGVLLCIKEANV